ncbi:MAG: helix-turn-helix domain-containing protein [Candidatus Gastranaerophilales bacterium]|nr:helix-turn-helix domain-containing protein [Candidatus Gastranaerophilales bacterium]
MEEAGHKNLISNRLIELRKKRGLSQRALAYQLQLIGVDVDKNVITRLETDKRHVTDIELRALCRVLHVSYEDLIEDQQ